MANKVLGIEQGTSGGTIGLEKGQSGLFWFYQKDGSRVYLVLAQDLNQTEDQVTATTGIPQIGTVVNGAPVRSLAGKELDRIAKHPKTGVPTILWSVTVTTDSRFDSSQIGGDATDLRPKRRWYSDKVKERRETDLTNEIIETLALEPIVFEDDFVDLILEIERYEDYPTDPSLIFAFENHTNSGSFYGAPIGTVLLDDIQSDEEVVNSILLCKVRYVFRFKLRWDEEAEAFELNTVRYRYLLQQGYMYRPSAGAEPITFIDAHGHPVKVNLTTGGVLAAETDPPLFTGFPIIPYADFDTLNLEF